MNNDCPSCFKNPATVHLRLGLFPCSPCKQRLDNLPSPNEQPEIIPDYIKAERQERQDSIEQPWFKGELNKRWVDLHGEEMARNKGFSDEEIRDAKYVYDGVRGGGLPGVRYYKDGE